MSTNESKTDENVNEKTKQQQQYKYKVQMNYTSNNLTNQAQSNYNLTLSEYFSDDLEGALGSMSRSHPIMFSILNQLISYNFRYKVPFFSQEKIANHVGCSRRYVNECIQLFSQWGLIYKIKRSYNSNVTFISKIFFKQNIIYGLRHVVPALKQASLWIQVQFSLLNYRFLKDDIKSRTSQQNRDGLWLRKFKFTDDFEAVLSNVREKTGIGSIVAPEYGFSPAINALRAYGFTLRDRIMLSQFDEKTLIAATRLFKEAKGVRNRAGWLMSMCRTLGGKSDKSIPVGLMQLFTEGKLPDEEVIIEPASKCTMVREQEKVLKRERAMKFAPDLRATQERDDVWDEQCALEYEKIEFEIAKMSVAAPAWLKKNPYGSRVSKEVKDRVAEKVIRMGLVDKGCERHGSINNKNNSQLKEG